MRISRMFEIIYILLYRERVTAKELAEKFEVSTRTIYRDVENISAAGIPIYMSKGKNGGIGLLKGYTLNKSVLSDEEKQNIISALKSFNSFDEKKGSNLLNKIGLFFGGKHDSYIEIDLMDWGGRVREAYDISKQAILERKVISFDYISPSSGLSSRKVEPYKLYFKASTWYLKSYCLTKKSQRLFRLSRMKNIVVTDTVFAPRVLENTALDELSAPKVKLKLKINKSEQYRVLDEFSDSEVKRDSNGDYLVETEMIESSWIIGYLMSYGKNLTVISPENIRTKIKAHVEGLSKNYL